MRKYMIVAPKKPSKLVTPVASRYLELADQLKQKTGSLRKAAELMGTSHNYIINLRSSKTLNKSVGADKLMAACRGLKISMEYFSAPPGTHYTEFTEEYEKRLADRIAAIIERKKDPESGIRTTDRDPPD